MHVGPYFILFSIIKLGWIFKPQNRYQLLLHILEGQYRLKYFKPFTNCIGGSRETMSNRPKKKDHRYEIHIVSVCMHLWLLILKPKNKRIQPMVEKNVFFKLSHSSED